MKKVSIHTIGTDASRFCAKFVCSSNERNREDAQIISFPQIEEWFCVPCEEKVEFFKYMSSIRMDINAAEAEKTILEALDANLEIAEKLEKLNNKDSADLLGGIITSIGEMLITAGKSETLMMSYIHMYKSYLPIFKSATEFLKVTVSSFYKFSKIVNAQAISFENEADNVGVTTTKTLKDSFNRVKKNVAAMAAYIYS